MKFFAKGLVVAGALVGASLTGLDAANAMPIAPDGAAAPSAPVEKVTWPCGPGWHQNPWGRCVPWGYGYGYGYGYGRPYWGYRRYWGPRWGYGRGFYGRGYYGRGHYRHW